MQVRAAKLPEAGCLHKILRRFHKQLSDQNKALHRGKRALDPKPTAYTPDRVRHGGGSRALWPQLSGGSGAVGLGLGPGLGVGARPRQIGRRTRLGGVLREKRPGSRSGRGCLAVRERRPAPEGGGSVRPSLRRARVLRGAGSAIWWAYRRERIARREQPYRGAAVWQTVHQHLKTLPLWGSVHGGRTGINRGLAHLSDGEVGGRKRTCRLPRSPLRRGLAGTARGPPRCAWSTAAPRPPPPGGGAGGRFWGREPRRRWIPLPSWRGSGSPGPRRTRPVPGNVLNPSAASIWSTVYSRVDMLGLQCSHTDLKGFWEHHKPYIRQYRRDVGIFLWTRQRESGG